MNNTDNNLNFEVANRRRRLVAFFIDHAFFSFLASFIGLFLIGTRFEELDFDWTFVLMIILIVFIFILYSSKDYFNGISLGRWIVGIMVRDNDDKNLIPSQGRLFKRNLYLILLPVELYNFIFNKEKRRLGDKRQNTIVLNNPNKIRRGLRVIVLVSFGVLFYALTSVLSTYMLKSSDAYVIAFAKVNSDETIKKEVGDIKRVELTPNGSINIVNGYGNCIYRFKIYGNIKDVEATVHLLKDPNGIWTVSGISN